MTKNISVVLLLLLLASRVSAQHSSEDFKDASGCGPFPLYISIGYATSRYSDFSSVADTFTEYYSPGTHVKDRMNGISAIFGFTIIPKKWSLPVSVFAEAKYLWLYREQRAGDYSFSMNSGQLSGGLGLRYAAFPFVVSGYVGAAIFCKQDFNFNLGAIERGTKLSSGGMNLSVRLTFLDPAGSDGGIGYFIECGRNAVNRGSDNALLTQVIKGFDNTFIENKKSATHYSYLSVGLVVPLAFSIK